jgi:predicted ATPase
MLMPMTDLLKKIIKTKVQEKSNFIHKIRFPRYKNLQNDTFLTFDSALTALVGPNGSGKSSVLTSLYGCPDGYSLGKYWFSTALDPIDESGGVNRIIYKFVPAGMDDSVEVIKKRVRSARTGARKNPDYWETARPSMTDNMAKMPDVISPEHAPFRNQSRWKAIDKKVVYIDFRSELSSFDISFYFKDMSKHEYYSHVQDFLRNRSKVLESKLLQPKYLPVTWHSQVINKVEHLTKTQLFWANKILGKTYTSAKRIFHTLFDNKGSSIIFYDGTKSYSEAVAGSGEVAVVNCVCRVLSAPENALILLDEPEVSLHPGAQNELRNLLFTAIIDKNAQIVISTHSEHFLKGLPSNAIKLFQQNPANNRFDVINECTPEQAFCRLGGVVNNKRKIYVEDNLAKAVVEAALDDIDSTIRSQYIVAPYSGGAETIIKNLSVHFAINDGSEDIVFLDGDKRCSVEPKDREKYKIKIENKTLVLKKRRTSISVSDYPKVNNLLREQTNVKGNTFPLPLNGGTAGEERNKEDKIQFQLKILDAYHNKFFFMNVDTPEELLWKISTGPFVEIFKAQHTHIDEYKDLLENSAKSHHGEEETNASTILQFQKTFLKNRNKKHPLWEGFLDELRKGLGVEQIEN